MLSGSIIGAIIGIVIVTIVSGLIIWLVGKLGLGIEVSGFGPAFLTAFFIALLWAFAAWLWNAIGYTPAGGISGAITHLILNPAARSGDLEERGKLRGTDRHRLCPRSRGRT